MKREDIAARIRQAADMHERHPCETYGMNSLCREAADALERLAPAEGELVERVARAIIAARYPDRPRMADEPIFTVDQGEVPAWHFYEREAAAIIPLILEEAAKVADVWAKTEADLEKSHNPTTARAIAAIASDTGAKIATAIRNLGRRA